MTITSADIVNQAIQLIGGFNNSGPVTGSPPNFDGTTLGIAAGTVYAEVVNAVARQFGWDFSRSVVTLSLTGSAAPMGYTYEYNYPTNGIQVRQLVPQTIADANDPRPIRWTVGNAVTGFTQATGDIFFSVNPSNGDLIVLNGVTITFVTGSPIGNQVQIQGTCVFTITKLVQLLQASVDPLITVASYSRQSSDPSQCTLDITYNFPGTVGNAYTLLASAATPSGPTLTGGTDAQQRVIWTNLQHALATYTNQPIEVNWDPLFQEAVVQGLAAKLALAADGKPESSALASAQSAGFTKLGEGRLDA